MDVNTLIQIINGVGFPIAACIAMGWFIVWSRKSNDQRFTEQDNAYKEVAKALDNNTRAIERLVDKLNASDSPI